jgi:DUF4097 and DUF4098 domain-containing protein YvlB
MRGFTAAIFLGLAAAALAAAPASAATLTETLDRTFPMPAAGGALDVDDVNGSITVEVWDRNEIRVEAVKEARAMSDADARDALRRVRIELSPSAGKLKIETHASGPEGFFDWLFHAGTSVSVSYDLHVPRRLDVRAHTVNGRVSLAGTRGMATLLSTNGSLQLADVEGEMRLETVSGRITIHQAAGPLHAVCTNGGIEADMTRLSGPLTLDTTNGSLRLRLPRDARADLEAGTTNGSVVSDLPVAMTTDSRRHLRGTVNGGGVPLKLSTTNGSVHIAAL